MYEIEQLPMTLYWIKLGPLGVMNREVEVAVYYRLKHNRQGLWDLLWVQSAVQSQIRLAPHSLLCLSSWLSIAACRARCPHPIQAVL